MPLEPFDQLYPEIARLEMRVCESPGLAELNLHKAYLLREFYCTEPDCDCRRVVVQFVPQDGPLQVAASINFGWERAKYYRKWSSDPELWREMSGATLERFAEQGPKRERMICSRPWKFAPWTIKRARLKRERKAAATPTKTNCGIPTKCNLGCRH